jgi:hypothetical protein
MARVSSIYGVDEPCRKQFGTARTIRCHDDAGFHAELGENLDPGPRQLAAHRAVSLALMKDLTIGRVPATIAMGAMAAAEKVS